MVVDYEPFIRVTYSRREKETSDDENTPEFNAMIDEIKETLNRLNNEIAGGMSAVFTTDNLRRGATTVNYIAAHAHIPLAKK